MLKRLSLSASFLLALKSRQDLILLQYLLIIAAIFVKTLVTPI